MLIRALDRLLKRLVISLFNLILHSIGHSLTHLFVVDGHRRDTRRDTPTGNSWTSDGKQLDFRRDTATGYTDGTPSRFVIRQPFEGTPTGNSWTSTPPPSLFESIAQTINHFIIRFGFPSIDHAVAHPIFLRIHLIHESIRLIRWDTDTTTPND